MSLNKKYLTLFYSCIIIFAIAVPVYAVSLSNPLGTTDIPTLIGRIIRGFLGIIGSIALLMFIYGGFTLLTSGGNPNQVQKGKNILVWATIGIVFIFVSFIAVGFVIDTLTDVGSEETSTIEEETSTE